MNSEILHWVFLGYVLGMTNSALQITVSLRKQGIDALWHIDSWLNFIVTIAGVIYIAMSLYAVM